VHNKKCVVESPKDLKFHACGVTLALAPEIFLMTEEDDSWDNGEEDDWTDDEWGEDEGWGEDEDW
jgi:hypothetical protein